MLLKKERDGIEREERKIYSNQSRVIFMVHDVELMNQYNHNQLYKITKI